MAMICSQSICILDEPQLVMHILLITKALLSFTDRFNVLEPWI